MKLNSKILIISLIITLFIVSFVSASNSGKTDIRVFVEEKQINSNITLEQNQTTITGKVINTNNDLNQNNIISLLKSLIYFLK